MCKAFILPLKWNSIYNLSVFFTLVQSNKQFKTLLHKSSRLSSDINKINVRKRRERANNLYLHPNFGFYYRTNLFFALTVFLFFFFRSSFILFLFSCDWTFVVRLFLVGFFRFVWISLCRNPSLNTFVLRSLCGRRRKRRRRRRMNSRMKRAGLREAVAMHCSYRCHLFCYSSATWSMYLVQYNIKMNKFDVFM